MIFSNTIIVILFQLCGNYIQTKKVFREIKAELLNQKKTQVEIPVNEYKFKTKHKSTQFPPRYRGDRESLLRQKTNLRELLGRTKSKDEEEKVAKQVAKRQKPKPKNPKKNLEKPQRHNQLPPINAKQPLTVKFGMPDALINPDMLKKKQEKSGFKSVDQRIREFNPTKIGKLDI